MRENDDSEKLERPELTDEITSNGKQNNVPTPTKTDTERLSERKQRRASYFRIELDAGELIDLTPTKENDFIDSQDSEEMRENLPKESPIKSKSLLRVFTLPTRTRE